MKLTDLTSRSNLLLAWRRITTGRNIHYKRLYRPLYEAYEHGHEDNITRLRQRIGRSWKSDPGIRVHLPKPSGLQRPITLLGLEDQVVLQAVANLFATRMRARRQRLEGTEVFSNLLSTKHTDAFFVQDWRMTYNLFRQRCAEHYQSGNKWIASFDLAAFYDTISHDLLLRIISPRGGGRELWDQVRIWLRNWTSVSVKRSYPHGLPQGPIASDFLA